MPLYTYHCENDHTHVRVLSVRDHCAVMPCPVCALNASQIIGAPTLVIQPECRYDSPIDGAPITTWAQRTEDLARHQCQPYDPGLKEDYQRRIVEEERTLDRAVDETVDAAVEAMPTAQRGALYSEVTEQGKALVYTRSTRQS